MPFANAATTDQTDLLSSALCSELCYDLRQEGVNDFHFYTLNKPKITFDVCTLLGIASSAGLRAVA